MIGRKRVVLLTAIADNSFQHFVALIFYFDVLKASFFVRKTKQICEQLFNISLTLHVTMATV